MGLSLQEQLLKAGMVNQKQVKKAQHDKRVENKKNKKNKKGGVSSEESAKVRLQQQQAEQAKQNQKLNAERNLQAQQKADQAAARQLIASNKVRLEEGGVTYHYVGSDGKIKRISVQQGVADKLADGLFGLAMHKSDLVLLPAETVMKVLQRDIDSIVAYNDPSEVEDDYPADW